MCQYCRLNRIVANAQMLFTWIQLCGTRGLVCIIRLINHSTVFLFLILPCSLRLCIYTLQMLQLSATYRTPMMCSVYINVLGVNRVLEFTSHTWSQRVFGAKALPVSAGSALIWYHDEYPF